jgi:hypothetical protein
LEAFTSWSVTDNTTQLSLKNRCNLSIVPFCNLYKFLAQANFHCFDRTDLKQTITAMIDSPQKKIPTLPL